MTRDEWYNLNPGDLILYLGGGNKPKGDRQNCVDMIMEIETFKHIETPLKYGTHVEEHYICKQPFVDSNWRFELTAPGLATVIKKKESD